MAFKFSWISIISYSKSWLYFTNRTIDGSTGRQTDYLSYSDAWGTYKKKKKKKKEGEEREEDEENQEEKEEEYKKV